MDNTRRSLTISAAVLVSLLALPAAAYSQKLPVYDHIVIVLEENKDYEQVVGSPAAPYINGTLKAEGADLDENVRRGTLQRGELFLAAVGQQSEHRLRRCDSQPQEQPLLYVLHAQSGPATHPARLVVQRLFRRPAGHRRSGGHARGCTPASTCPGSASATSPGQDRGDSSHLRWCDFPQDYDKLPTVSMVIPNLINDMHNGKPPRSVRPATFGSRRTSTAITSGPRRTIAS